MAKKNKKKTTPLATTITMQHFRAGGGLRESNPGDKVSQGNPPPPVTLVTLASPAIDGDTS